MTQWKENLRALKDLSTPKIIRMEGDAEERMVQYDSFNWNGQICLKNPQHSLFANHGQGLPRAKLEMYCLRCRQQQISSVALFYHFMQNITKHIIW